MQFLPDGVQKSFINPEGCALWFIGIIILVPIIIAIIIATFFKKVRFRLKSYKIIIGEV